MYCVLFMAGFAPTTWKMAHLDEWHPSVYRLQDKQEETYPNSKYNRLTQNKRESHDTPMMIGVTRRYGRTFRHSEPGPPLVCKYGMSA